MGTLQNYIPRHANREKQSMQMEETNGKILPETEST